MDAAKFNIRWVDHGKSVMKWIDYLAAQEKFTDVTLVAEGQFLQAHKNVLSACSPMIEGILSAMKDKDPVLFLPGSYKDLVNVLSYVYRGEVRLYEREVPSFCKALRRLCIRSAPDVPEILPDGVPEVEVLSDDDYLRKSRSVSTDTRASLSQVREHFINSQTTQESDLNKPEMRRGNYAEDLPSICVPGKLQKATVCQAVDTHRHHADPPHHKPRKRRRNITDENDADKKRSVAFNYCTINRPDLSVTVQSVDRAENMKKMRENALDPGPSATPMHSSFDPPESGEESQEEELTDVNESGKYSRNRKYSETENGKYSRNSTYPGCASSCTEVKDEPVLPATKGRTKSRDRVNKESGDLESLRCSPLVIRRSLRLRSRDPAGTEPITAEENHSEGSARYCVSQDELVKLTDNMENDVKDLNSSDDFAKRRKRDRRAQSGRKSKGKERQKESSPKKSETLVEMTDNMENNIFDFSSSGDFVNQRKVDQRVRSGRKSKGKEKQKGSTSKNSRTLGEITDNTENQAVDFSFSEDFANQWKGDQRAQSGRKSKGKEKQKKSPPKESETVVKITDNMESDVYNFNSSEDFAKRRKEDQRSRSGRKSKGREKQRKGPTVESKSVVNQKDLRKDRDDIEYREQDKARNKSSLGSDQARHRSEERFLPKRSVGRSQTRPASAPLPRSLERDERSESRRTNIIVERIIERLGQIDVLEENKNENFTGKQREFDPVRSGSFSADLTSFHNDCNGTHTEIVASSKSIRDRRHSDLDQVDERLARVSGVGSLQKALLNSTYDRARSASRETELAELKTELAKRSVDLTEGGSLSRKSQKARNSATRNRGATEPPPSSEMTKSLTAEHTLETCAETLKSLRKSSMEITKNVEAKVSKKKSPAKKTITEKKEESGGKVCSSPSLFHVLEGPTLQALTATPLAPPTVIMEANQEYINWAKGSDYNLLIDVKPRKNSLVRGRGMATRGRPIGKIRCVPSAIQPSKEGPNVDQPSPLLQNIPFSRNRLRLPDTGQPIRKIRIIPTVIQSTKGGSNIVQPSQLRKNVPFSPDSLRQHASSMKYDRPNLCDIIDNAPGVVVQTPNAEPECVRVGGCPFKDGQEKNNADSAGIVESPASFIPWVEEQVGVSKHSLKETEPRVETRSHKKNEPSIETESPPSVDESDNLVSNLRKRGISVEAEKQKSKIDSLFQQDQTADGHPVEPERIVVEPSLSHIGTSPSSSLIQSELSSSPSLGFRSSELNLSSPVSSGRSTDLAFKSPASSFGESNCGSPSYTVSVPSRVPCVGELEQKGATTPTRDKQSEKPEIVSESSKQISELERGESVVSKARSTRRTKKLSGGWESLSRPKVVSRKSRLGQKSGQALKPSTTAVAAILVPVPESIGVPLSPVETCRETPQENQCVPGTDRDSSGSSTRENALPVTSLHSKSHEWLMVAKQTQKQPDVAESPSGSTSKEESRRSPADPTPETEVEPSLPAEATGSQGVRRTPGSSRDGSGSSTRDGASSVTSVRSSTQKSLMIEKQTKKQLDGVKPPSGSASKAESRKSRIDQKSRRKVNDSPAATTTILGPTPESGVEPSLPAETTGSGGVRRTPGSSRDGSGSSTRDGAASVKYNSSRPSRKERYEARQRRKTQLPQRNIPAETGEGGLPLPNDLNIPSEDSKLDVTTDAGRMESEHLDAQSPPLQPLDSTSVESNTSTCTPVANPPPEALTPPLKRVEELPRSAIPRRRVRSYSEPRVGSFALDSFQGEFKQQFVSLKSHFPAPLSSQRVDEKEPSSESKIKEQCLVETESVTPGSVSPVRSTPLRNLQQVSSVVTSEPICKGGGEAGSSSAEKAGPAESLDGDHSEPLKSVGSITTQSQQGDPEVAQRGTGILSPFAGFFPLLGPATPQTDNASPPHPPQLGQSPQVGILSPENRDVSDILREHRELADLYESRGQPTPTLDEPPYVAPNPSVLDDIFADIPRSLSPIDAIPRRVIIQRRSPQTETLLRMQRMNSLEQGRPRTTSMRGVELGLLHSVPGASISIGEPTQVLVTSPVKSRVSDRSPVGRMIRPIPEPALSTVDLLEYCTSPPLKKPCHGSGVISDVSCIPAVTSNSSIRGISNLGEIFDDFEETTDVSLTDLPSMKTSPLPRFIPANPVENQSFNYVPPSTPRESVGGGSQRDCPSVGAEVEVAHSPHRSPFTNLYSGSVLETTVDKTIKNAKLNQRFIPKDVLMPRKKVVEATRVESAEAKIRIKPCPASAKKLAQNVPRNVISMPDLEEMCSPKSVAEELDEVTEPSMTEANYPPAVFARKSKPASSPSPVYVQVLKKCGPIGSPNPFVTKGTSLSSYIFGESPARAESKDSPAYEEKSDAMEEKKDELDGRSSAASTDSRPVSQRELEHPDISEQGSPGRGKWVVKVERLTDVQLKKIRKRLRKKELRSKTPKDPKEDPMLSSTASQTPRQDPEPPRAAVPAATHREVFQTPSQRPLQLRRGRASFRSPSGAGNSLEGTSDMLMSPARGFSFFEGTIGSEDGHDWEFPIDVSDFDLL